MRVCLFDWNEAGHHAEVAKAVASSLRPGVEVVLAAPDATLKAVVGDPTVIPISLGEGRPRPSPSAPGTSKAELANAELDLLEEIVRQVKPDHLILLWADPVLRWLLKRPPLPTAVSLYVFIAPLHYGRAYSTRLGPRQKASAYYKELNILRWLRRPDAHALFGLDALAVQRWRHYPHARAHPLPEAPLSYVPVPHPAEQREGFLLFGYMDERKGIDRIAAATAKGCEGMRLKLYGEPAPEYEERLAREIDRMRESGVIVETRLERLPYEEALDSLASARGALLSFGWVPHGSRVLLEAAASGTPVVGSDLGAVGYLIREHNLGLTASPSDSGALREAIQAIAFDPNSPRRYSESLRAYSAQLNGSLYRREIRDALGLSAD